MKQKVDRYSYEFSNRGVKKRNEFNDYDYIHKLDNKTRKWLSSFHREWDCADMKHSGQIFHSKFIDRKKCYDKNNEINRDIYAIKRTTKQLIFVKDLHRIIDDKNYLFNERLEEVMYG